MPTLGEAFTWLAGRALINVEVKRAPSGLYEGLCERLAAEIRTFDLTEHVVVSSFEPEYLRRLHRLLPDLEVALLYNKPLPDPVGLAVAEGWGALHPQLRLVDAEFVERAHARGLLVRAWNPNEPAEMAPLLDLGVDGIGTDYPERLVALRASRG